MVCFVLTVEIDGSVTMKLRDSLTAGCTLAFVFSVAQANAQLTVYDNLASGSWSSDYPRVETLPASGTLTDEFGDEIMLLDNTPRTINTFILQYYTENQSGNISAVVRFYLNDGALDQDLFQRPNTEIYSSGLIPLPQISGTGLLTLQDINVTVPDAFTWTVQFSGLGGSDVARLAINGPQSVGTSFEDFWQKSAGVWKLEEFSDPSNPGSFGAAITAVPEPMAAQWVMLTTAIGLGIGLRRFRQAQRHVSSSF